MKRKITASLLIVLTVLSLAACGKAFTCDLCGEEKTGKSYTESVLGTEITYCKDCHDELEALGNELKGLLD